MSNPPFKLFHYWRSSSSWRVRMALEYKKISFEPVSVHLLNGESESETHLARNPAGFVPVLETPDHHYLTESLAIIRYLEELYPAPSLLPGTALDRAIIWAMAEMVNAGIQPIQNIPVMTHHSSDPEKQKQWNQHWIRNGLAIFEKFAERHSDQFSYGNALTLADVCLVPQCYNAERYEVDLEAYPAIARVYAHCLTLGAVQKSHPDEYKPVDFKA